MDDPGRHDKVMNLLNYAACLSEPGVAPETPERMKEINRCVHEAAHLILTQNRR